MLRNLISLDRLKDILDTTDRGAGKKYSDSIWPAENPYLPRLVLRSLLYVLETYAPTVWNILVNNFKVMNVFRSHGNRTPDQDISWLYDCPFGGEIGDEHAGMSNRYAVGTTAIDLVCTSCLPTQSNTKETILASLTTAFIKLSDATGIVTELLTQYESVRQRLGNLILFGVCMPNGTKSSGFGIPGLDTLFPIVLSDPKTGVLRGFEWEEQGKPALGKAAPVIHISFKPHVIFGKLAEYFNGDYTTPCNELYDMSNTNIAGIEEVFSVDKESLIEKYKDTVAIDEVLNDKRNNWNIPGIDDYMGTPRRLIGIATSIFSKTLNIIGDQYPLTPAGKILRGIFFTGTDSDHNGLTFNTINEVVTGNVPSADTCLAMDIDINPFAKPIGDVFTGQPTSQTFDTSHIDKDSPVYKFIADIISRDSVADPLSSFFDAGLQHSYLEAIVRAFTAALLKSLPPQLQVGPPDIISPNMDQSDRYNMTLGMMPYYYARIRSLVMYWLSTIMTSFSLAYKLLCENTSIELWTQFVSPDSKGSPINGFGTAKEKLNAITDESGVNISTIANIKLIEDPLPRTIVPPIGCLFSSGNSEIVEGQKILKDKDLLHKLLSSGNDMGTILKTGSTTLHISFAWQLIYQFLHSSILNEVATEMNKQSNKGFMTLLSISRQVYHNYRTNMFSGSDIIDNRQAEVRPISSLSAFFSKGSGKIATTQLATAVSGRLLRALGNNAVGFEVVPMSEKLLGCLEQYIEGASSSDPQYQHVLNNAKSFITTFQTDKQEVEELERGVVDKKVYIDGSVDLTPKEIDNVSNVSVGTDSKPRRSCFPSYDSVISGPKGPEGRTLSDIPIDPDIGNVGVRFPPVRINERTYELDVLNKIIVSASGGIDMVSMLATIKDLQQSPDMIKNLSQIEKTIPVDTLPNPAQALDIFKQATKYEGEFTDYTIVPDVLITLPDKLVREADVVKGKCIEVLNLLTTDNLGTKEHGTVKNDIRYPILSMIIDVASNPNSEYANHATIAMLCASIVMSAIEQGHTGDEILDTIIYDDMSGIGPDVLGIVDVFNSWRDTDLWFQSTRVTGDPPYHEDIIANVGVAAHVLGEFMVGERPIPMQAYASFIYGEDYTLTYDKGFISPAPKMGEVEVFGQYSNSIEGKMFLYEVARVWFANNLNNISVPIPRGVHVLAEGTDLTVDKWKTRFGVPEVIVRTQGKDWDDKQFYRLKNFIEDDNKVEPDIPDIDWIKLRNTDPLYFGMRVHNNNWGEHGAKAIRDKLDDLGGPLTVILNTVYSLLVEAHNKDSRIVAFEFNGIYENRLEDGKPSKSWHTSGEAADLNSIMLKIPEEVDDSLYILRLRDYINGNNKSLINDITFPDGLSLLKQTPLLVMETINDILHNMSVDGEGKVIKGWQIFGPYMNYSRTPLKETAKGHSHHWHIGHRVV